MARKKWTPQGDADPAVQDLRVKRKWQIALRRYLEDPGQSSFYAPYFGLTRDLLRNWLELQFRQDMNWSNFSSVWQLTTLIPMEAFDFGREEDLRLCWNFINIRAEAVNQSGKNLELLGARDYFQTIFAETGYPAAGEMIKKINELLAQQTLPVSVLSFLHQQGEFIGELKELNQEELLRINKGVALEEIRAERALLRRFGAQ